MSGEACYPVVVGGDNCIQCDEVIAVEGVPEQTIITILYGWTASAISGDRLAGNVYTQFDVPASVGVVVGLEIDILGQNPDFIRHGFYIYETDGNHWRAVIESGVTKTTPVVWAASDLFRIERRDGVVRYFVNGRQEYESLVPLTSDVIVVACLYASGDGVN